MNWWNYEFLFFSAFIYLMFWKLAGCKTNTTKVGFPKIFVIYWFSEVRPKKNTPKLTRDPPPQWSRPPLPSPRSWCKYAGGPLGSPARAASGAGWLSSILSGCRVCSGSWRAARAASGAVCRLPSCQGAVCALMDEKELPGLPVVPTGAYCLQNWQSRHTKLSYIIECVKYHRFIECAKYHRFLVEK